MVSLSGRKMVVIGGSSGIGRRIVEAGIRNGAQVLAVAWQKVPLMQLALEIPGVEILALDATTSKLHSTSARLRLRGVGEALEVCVRIRFEPGHVERRATFQLRRAGGAKLVGQVPLLMLAAFEGIEASVGGDAVKPGAKRSALIVAAGLEARETAPGTQPDFLHGVFSFVQGAQHAVAMQCDFAAEGFGKALEGLGSLLRGMLGTGWIWSWHCE